MKEMKTENEESKNKINLPTVFPSLPKMNEIPRHKTKISTGVFSLQRNICN
jgi:hypothetical protein